MSQEQDKIFFRNFSLVLAFIAAIMLAFYFTAKLVTGKKELHGVIKPAINNSIELVSGDLINGKNLSQPCAVCHSTDGNSVNPIWPKLAGQHSIYIVKQLNDFKDGDRVNVQMAGMVASLTEQDMLDLALYFEDQKNNLGFAEPDLVSQGQKIYRAGDSEKGIAACMACHGPAGSGNPGAMYPSLRGQHAEYTMMQLKMFKTGERNNDANAVMRSIAGRMTDSQINAVSEYIQGLRLR